MQGVTTAPHRTHLAATWLGHSWTQCAQLCVIMHVQYSTVHTLMLLYNNTVVIIVISRWCVYICIVYACVAHSLFMYAITASLLYTLSG